MKRFTLTLVVLAVASVAPLHAQTFTFSGLNAAVPDGNPNGLSNTQTISTSTTAIGALTLTLNLFGTYNGDIYAYVTHSSGFAVLLNRVGRTGNTGSASFGYGDAGFQVTFSDSASNGDVHVYRNVMTPGAGSPLTGLWQPDARDVDPGLVTDTSTRSAYLSSFNGLDPNGSWTLFIADMSSGDTFTLDSWGLDITPVPEPATWAAGLLILGALAYTQLRRRKSRPSR